MRTLVLGATGFIGHSICHELITHNHNVVALARSDASAAKLADKGIDVIRGNLREPAEWCAIVANVDAIIHVAATFSNDMGDVDNHLIETLIAQAELSPRKKRFIYTGGCWLYGQTGDRVAAEGSPFDPFPPFAWMIENSRKIFAAPCFDTMMIHPAMVYDRDGGAISRMLSSASEAGGVEVWGGLNIRWPVVHREDLACAYRLVLERGEVGQSYCVSAEKGVAVGEMALAISRRFNLINQPLVLTNAQLAAKHGEEALGPTLDQQMSGKKIANILGWAPKFKNILSVIE